MENNSRGKINRWPQKTLKGKSELKTAVKALNILLCDHLAGYLSPSACSRPPSCLRSCSLLAPSSGTILLWLRSACSAASFPSSCLLEPAPQTQCNFSGNFFHVTSTQTTQLVVRKQNTLLVMFFSYNLWIREIIHKWVFLAKNYIHIWQEKNQALVSTGKLP